MKKTWNTTHIGEIAQVKGGKRLPKGKLVGAEETNHPYVRVVDFGPDGVNSANLKYIDDETHSAISRYTISDDDVYISIAGTIGRVGIVPKTLSGANLTENAAKICDIDSSMDKRFLMYFLRSRFGQSYIESQIVGTSQPKLALFRIKDIEVPCPPLTTQQEIAAILTVYDDLIENNTRRIRILAEMAQSLYREWFVHFRFPGHEKVKLVDSPLGKTPEGWKAAKLSEIAHVNASSIRRGEDPEEINFVDIASVSMGYIEKTETLTFIDAPGRARRKVKHGDIIWSTVRPNRQSYSIILDPLPNLIVSTGFAVITALEVPFTYLYQAATTEEFVSYLSNHAKGSAYPAVTAADFMNSNVLLPTQAILEAYNKIVEPLLILKQNKLNKNANLRSTRDLLLPKLISGEVEASNLREDAI